MSDKYIGKTNKELIIEVIGKMENIEEKLGECRPICFSTRSKLNIIAERQKNYKWLISGVTGLITILINIIFIIIKRLKGG